jgi:hypothetical protein
MTTPVSLDIHKDTPRIILNSASLVLGKATLFSAEATQRSCVRKNERTTIKLGSKDKVKFSFRGDFFPVGERDNLTVVNQPTGARQIFTYWGELCFIHSDH